MTTLEVNIFDDEALIIDVLKAFEQRKSLSFSEKKMTFAPTKKMTENEYEEMLNHARTTPTYTLSQAKEFLKI